jgi:hypothetical protein
MNYNEESKDLFLIYDNINLKYNKYLKYTNAKFDSKKNILTMKFDDEEVEFVYEFLGTYDSESRIWSWGWSTLLYKWNEDTLSYRLLTWGITYYDSDPESFNNHYKKVIINSKIFLETELELDNHIATITLLQKNDMKFIYSEKKYLDEMKEKYFIDYYYIY